MKKISKIVLVLGVLLISTTLVSAALLPYFGKVKTTMNVQQSVIIGEGGSGIVWHNWDEPVIRDLGDVAHCTDYCYKLLIKNQAYIPANVYFTDVCTASPQGKNREGIDIAHYVFGDSQTIELRYKDADWHVIPGLGANITFNTCGQTFNYTIDYWNLAITEPYSLVYYIDQEDRFTNWGKVFVIGNLGILSGTGTTGQLLADIPTMPYVDDWNAGPEANYTESDGYVHANGAKFWLVPTSDINAEQDHLINWTPELFLFETDLALYIDCDDWTPICLPYVYPIFDTTVLQPLSTYCWISCYHVVFNIMGGHYAFKTTVTAEI